MSAPDEFTALVERVQEISRLFDRIKAARYLPNRCADAVKQLRVNSTSYDGMTGAQKIIVERMLANAIAEEIKAGEVARDRELKRMAVQLDALRDDLPALAQAARFALLDMVLELRA